MGEKRRNQAKHSNSGYIYSFLEEEMASSSNNLTKSQQSTFESRELNKIMAPSPEGGLMKPCC